MLTRPQGDFEAIAYQAVSIASITTPISAKTRDWAASDDIRAAEAELRHALHFVVQDAFRPWLWLFKSTTVEKIGQNTDQLPEIDGYRLQRTFLCVSYIIRLANISQANRRELSRPSI